MQIDPPFRPPGLPPKGDVQYRLYFLDSAGRINRVHEFFAADDARAAEIAEGWREGRAMELWSRDRKVKTWP